VLSRGRGGKGARAGLNKNRKKLGKVQNDSRVDWRQAWALFPGDVAYVWHAGLHAGEVEASLRSSGFIPRAQIVWTKDRFALSRGDYHWQHEPCWYAVRGAGRPSEPKTVARARCGPYHHARMRVTVMAPRSPVEVMARPIRNHQEAEIYDPFVGSGTTLIAAEQLGRRCFGIEIEPAYCDVVLRRWATLTGSKAKREAGHP
jgi:DNA methylase